LERLIGSVPEETEKRNETIRNTLLSKHPNLKLLLKLGHKGCAILGKNQFYYRDVVTSYNKNILNDYKIVDTTGAGDCNTGSFFVKYAELFLNADNKEDEAKKYEKCLNFANAAAFLCITKKGAMPSNPTLSDLKAFTAKYLPEL